MDIARVEDAQGRAEDAQGRVEDARGRMESAQGRVGDAQGRVGVWVWCMAVLYHIRARAGNGKKARRLEEGRTRGGQGSDPRKISRRG